MAAIIRHALVAGSLLVVGGCAAAPSDPAGPQSSATAAPATAPAADHPKSPRELEKLMRTHMNTSYSQLVFLVFHAEGEPEFPRIEEEAARLRQTVQTVRDLKAPPMVTSDAARSVYMTYNDTLQSTTARFAEAVAQRDPPKMQAVLTKVGQTCNDCHHFFRVDVADAPAR